MGIWLALAAAAWLGLVAWQDATTKQVTNWLTIPPLLLVSGWWTWRGEWVVLLFLLALVGVTEVFDRLRIEPVVAVSVMPVVAGAMSYLGSERAATVVVAWGIVWLAWMVHLFGEADAKVLMVLIGFWPDVRLMGLLVGAQLLWSVYHLVRRYRSDAFRVSVAHVASIPADEELQALGVPTLPAYAAAGWGYFLLLATGVL